MLKGFKRSFNKGLRKLFPLLLIWIGKPLLHCLAATCKWKISGLEEFREIAKNEKCMLMLWHNRLAFTPLILYRFAPDFIYGAFVSKSRDGELISAVVESYKAGRTIRVSHQGRHNALRELMRHIEERKEIVIITPDGPRGPRYELKSGIAMAALETGAHVVPLTWTASSYWELPTWDRLRIPKPFSTIEVEFKNSVTFASTPEVGMEEACKVLTHALGVGD